MKYRILLITMVIACVAVIARAQTPSTSLTGVKSFLEGFRSIREVQSVSLVVPTVVEVPFDVEPLERDDVGVLDVTRSLFEPSYVRQETYTNQIPLTVTADQGRGMARNMIDGSTRTFTEFYFTENAENKSRVVMTSQQPITSSRLTLVLDDNVALPYTVEIRALDMVGSEERIVVATRRMESGTVMFPRTTSNRWIVTLQYGQPLRIAELRLNQENAQKITSRSLRFLAQPDHQYRIYFNPDRQVRIPVREAGNLALNQDIVNATTLPTQPNPWYVIADTDGDGRPNINDNCVSVSNADQTDINANGRGDVCDDFDKDGIPNHRDNCPNLPNRDQRDTDSDRAGDACDQQESRITERNPWIPWVGIGSAAIVLIVLFAMTMRSLPKRKG